MERKDFIKKSCTACLAIGAGWLLTGLAGCAHLPIFRTWLRGHEVAVPLSLFAAGDLQIISPKGMEYDVALRKEKDNTYTALLLRCTHADNQVSSTDSGFICSLHGSTFDREGAVTQGPADLPMKRYPTSVRDTNIIITID